MRQRLTLFIIVALLLIAVHRSPAPIVEEEKQTPVPTKGAVKPKVTSETSEGSTKRPTSSTSKTKATSNRNPFDGVWTGSFKGGYECLLTISGSGTAVSYLLTKPGLRREAPATATCDGTTMRWTTRLIIGSCAWTLTPNPDRKTALVTLSCLGSKDSEAFRRVSQ